MSSIDEIFENFEKSFEYGVYVGEGFSPLTPGYPKVVSTDYPVWIRFRGDFRDLREDIPEEITYQGRVYYLAEIFIEKASSYEVIGVLAYKVKGKRK